MIVDPPCCESGCGRPATSVSCYVFRRGLPVTPRPFCDAHAEFFVRRYNVPFVPIGSLADVEDGVRRLAHAYWVEEGMPDGRAPIHWAMACDTARDWYARSVIPAAVNSPVPAERAPASGWGDERCPLSLLELIEDAYGHGSDQYETAFSVWQSPLDCMEDAWDSGIECKPCCDAIRAVVPCPAEPGG